MADGPFSFAGEHYTITDYDGQPLPVQRPHPPILIGGGGPRVLGIAAREADIVGINGTLTAGVVGPEAIATMTLEAVEERMRHVREVAGERIDDIELNIRVVLHQRHRRPRRHASTASPEMIGVEPAMIEASPFALIGDVEQIIEDDPPPPRGARLQLPHRRRRRRRALRPGRRRPRRHLTRHPRVSSAGCRRANPVPAKPSDGRTTVAVSRRGCGPSRSRRCRPALIVKPLGVVAGVEADAVPRRDLHVLVDDAAVQPGARADPHAREQDGVGDVGVVVDEHAGRDDRALDVGRPR